MNHMLDPGALVVFDVSSRNTFKEVFPGVPGGNQWLRALRDNVDPTLFAAAMLVENKVDKLDAKALERPATFVQDAEVKRLLAETVFREPENGLGWLHDAHASETVPFRVANSLMYARTSALTNQCELFELTDKAAFTTDLFSHVYTPTATYEQTGGVKSITQALEALVVRIYARSKDIRAGGSKPSGAVFKVHVPPKDSGSSGTMTSGCC